ncbi:MAG: guanylate kinase [Planctomycetaceae bacterium]|nr:guanylate kinase [Planctomycetaceae bacterium]
MNNTSQQSNATGKIIVISGPSGVGKSTICQRIIKEFGEGLYSSVSATTRARKNGETEGADYFFISQDEFKKQVKAGNFLEWAEVFGNFYGTPKDRVHQALEQGKIVLLEIDVKGAKAVKKLYPDAALIFIMPPRHQELQQRIISRGRDEQADVETRLAGANDEIEAGWLIYDFVIINDELESAVAETIQTIKKAIGVKND